VVLIGWIKGLTIITDMTDRHNVYVVELDKEVLAKKKFLKLNPNYNPELPPLYVGETGLSPEARFEKHKTGLKANIWVKNHGLRLRPEHYKDLNPMPFHKAERTEEWLAKKLRAEGYPVVGGNPRTVPLKKEAGEEALQPQQARVIKKIQDKNTSGLVLYHGMGSGKGLVIGSKILTPTGWINIEDIKQNTEVISVNGVKANVTGVYPQGYKDVYKITFRDGATIECDDSHLWFTQSRCERKNYVKSKDQFKYRWVGKVRSTSEIKDTVLSNDNSLNYTIPIVKPIHFKYRKLPLDPYFVGLILGDGSICGGGCAITTADDEILQSIKSLFPNFTLKKYSKYTYGLGKPKGYNSYIVQAFKELKLQGMNCFTKFIPDIYMFNTVKSRIALLQGLMDTDGTVSKDGMAIVYESVSKQLADGVQFLVESLGGLAKITTRIPTYSYKGEKKKGALCYRVWLSLPPNINPFRLHRKAIQVIPKTKYKPTRYIKSIEYVGKKETICIAIDDPSHLYITEHCIVTHNTRESIESWKALGLPKTDIIVPASLKSNYRKELQRWYGNSNPSNINLISQQRFANSKLNTPIYNTGLQIVDEAQKAKNSNSELYQALVKTNPAKRLLLSGTPILNDPTELSNLVNLVAKKQVLPNNLSEFKKQYFKQEEVKPGFFGRLMGVSPGIQYKLQNKAQLSKILDKYVDYYKPTQEGYPTVTEQEVNVPMGAKQQEIYDTILGKTPFWTRYRIKHNLPPGRGELEGMRAFLSGPRQVSNSTAGFTKNLRDVESPKIDAAFKFLQIQLKQDPNYKALVYSNYLNNGLRPYESLLRKNNIPFGEFSGAVTPTIRDQAVKDYNANKLRALLVSGAGAEGLDLKATNLTQLLEPFWNLPKERQVIGRSVRFHSHDSLPPEKRKVLVQRYFATPKPSLLDKLTFNPKPTGTDSYIRNSISKPKDNLNQEITNLIAKNQEPKSWLNYN